MVLSELRFYALLHYSGEAFASAPKRGPVHFEPKSPQANFLMGGCRTGRLLLSLRKHHSMSSAQIRHILLANPLHVVVFVFGRLQD